MVQRSSVLLSTCLLLGSLSVACEPETLRIHVPPTGLHSVNQEDLRRAYWAVERSESPSQWWSKRTTQLQLQSVGSTCYLYEGQTDTIAVVYAQSTPMHLTVMASIAKALDRTEPSWSWQFCLVEQIPTANTTFQTVIDLTEELQDSIPFVEVNFETLALQVQSILREQLLLE